MIQLPESSTSKGGICEGCRIKMGGRKTFSLTTTSVVLQQTLWVSVVLWAQIKQYRIPHNTLPGKPGEHVTFPSWGMQVTHTFSSLESFELGSFSLNHLMNFYARCTDLSPSVCPKASMNIWHAIAGSGSQAWLNCSPSVAKAQLGTPGKSRAQQTQHIPTCALFPPHSAPAGFLRSCDSARGLCKHIFWRGSGISFQFFPKIMEVAPSCTFSLGIYRARRCLDLLLVVFLEGRFYLLAGI